MITMNRVAKITLVTAIISILPYLLDDIVMHTANIKFIS